MAKRHQRSAIAISHQPCCDSPRRYNPPWERAMTRWLSAILAAGAIAARPAPRAPARGAPPPRPAHDGVEKTIPPPPDANARGGGAPRELVAAHLPRVPAHQHNRT